MSEVDIIKSLEGLDHHLNFTTTVDDIDHVNIKRAITEIESLRAQLSQARSDALEEAAQLVDNDKRYRSEQLSVEPTGSMQRERFRVAVQHSDLLAKEIRSLKEPTL
jgi:hypothetical protein